MRTATRTTRGARILALPSGFAWLKHLDAQEQALFLSGLLNRVLGATQNGDWGSVSEWVEEWKATANIYAEPQITRDVKRGREELARGESVDWETLRKELGL